ncbi:hypothetical protein ACJZ2D_011085 [Fusarium nematophilum]
MGQDRGPRLPIEEQWLQFKPQIRRLYVNTDMPQPELAALLRHEGLSIPGNQLEYKLKKWEMSKNIDGRTWKFIDYNITKRKREGKESEVIRSGKRVKQSTVDKETARHRDASIFAQLLPASPPPVSLSATQLAVCTPAPFPMEFEWPSTLPWLTFQDIFLTWSSNFREPDTPRSRTMTEPETPHLDILVSKIANRWGAQAADAVTRPSRLAANIGRTMPESYQGEHLQAAQVLFTNSRREAMIQCLKFVIYQMSNAMTRLWDGIQEWEATCQFFSRTGLLDTAISLKEVREQSLTASAFLDNLFRASITGALRGKHQKEHETLKRALFLTKWLLSSGQNPNICMDRETPLERAVRAAHADLTDILLKAGADRDLTFKRSPQTSLMGLALASNSSGIDKLRTIKLLLPQCSSTDLAAVLQAAIKLRDRGLVKEVLERGPNLTRMLKAELPLDHETALSAAAGVDLETTDSILHHLESQYPSASKAAFIRPDVFIAAATAGNTDVILYLHRISPIGHSPNLHGITPLQVAVSRGHLETCQLLLKIYGGLSAALIYIACACGHLGALRYLLQNGLSANEPMTSGDAKACSVLCKLQVEDVASGQPVTALQCLLSIYMSTGSLLFFGSPPHWLDLLIQQDAVLPEGSVVKFAALGWNKALLAALNAGGSPDETFPNGKTALQSTLDDHCFMGWAERLRTVKILLEKGAKLGGGEVLQALRIPDRDVVLLLLQYGASLVDTDDNRGPTLDAAIGLDDDELLERVVEELSGFYDAGSLCAAVYAGNTWIIELLLSNRPQQAQADLLEGTAVGLAAQGADIDLLQRLLEHLGKPDAALLPFNKQDGVWDFRGRWNFWRDERQKLVEGSPLALAISKEGNDEGFSELLRNGYRADRLTWLRAARTKHYPCLKPLLGSGQGLGYLPPHALETDFLLWQCIEEGNKEVLRSLLEAGADVNEHKRTRIDNPGTRSPLQFAVELGNLDIIHCLVQARANINAPPSFFRGATALQIAAIQGDLGMANQLLDLGARINARGARQCGRTALEGAAEHGRLDMLQVLLHFGALTTGAGRVQFVRAIHFAERGGHDAAAILLRRSRAWTDEDADLYMRSPQCDSCDGGFDFEDGQTGWVCMEDEDGQAPCCDEIHRSGDACIHDYSEVEEAWYADRAREMYDFKHGEPDSESEEDEEFYEESIHGSDEDEFSMTASTSFFS